MRRLPTTLHAVLASLLVLTLGPGVSGQAVAADPFSQGSMRASVIVGSGRAFDENYLIIGGGLAYYLTNGLEVGVDAEAWTGNDPKIYKFSPEARYVFPLRSPVRPYVGAFYRLTDIQDHDNLESVGYRAGIYMVAGGGSYFGLGMAQENYLDCNESIYQSCDDTYVEATINIALR